MGADATTINVDVGGTFTDGYVTSPDGSCSVKVPTTEHDPTACFMDCIERAAEVLDRPVVDLLDAAETVRFSTTLGTNTVIERTGPRLGVLVTDGHASDCYAPADRPSVRNRFVDGDLVAGLRERVTPDGAVERAPDPEAVVASVKRLQERGARLVVIGLANAHANDANERAVKRAIADAYPGHYIGSIPTLATYEATARPADYRRLNSTVVNAYLHRPMKQSLYRAEDQLRDRGFDAPLRIGHSSGGCARVAKTIALNTYNSGPVAGVLAVRSLARLYERDLLGIDMGGTSIDVSAVSTDELPVDLVPRVAGLETAVPAITVSTVGAGGGSIATVDGGELRVGPASAGAIPGPACYGQGGDRATVTDADVVLGYLDPDDFLGGRRRLEADRARVAIERAVAEPLGVDVETAARRIVDRVSANVSAELDALGVTGTDIVAYGGAGPVHAAGFAEQLDAERVLVSPDASVFSAFGASMMDVRHTVERPLLERSVAAVEQVVKQSTDELDRDLAAEGFDRSAASFRADLVVTPDDGTDPRQFAFELPVRDGPVGALLEECPPGRDTVRTHAVGPVPTHTYAATDLGEPDPASAREAERPVRWPSGWRDTPVYRFGELRPGHRVDGPAIAQAEHTTIVVPEGQTLTLDEYGHGVVE